MNQSSSLSNLFESFGIFSKQNNRYLIIGPSGSGKTHLSYQLIFFVLPKYRRHIYIYGSNDALKTAFIPRFKDLNIQIFELPIIHGSDLSKLDFDALKVGDLVIVDDLSHILAERDNELIKFLNKAYTASRHKGFDIITILHKYKLNNRMIRDNCTKIFITGINNEIINEFGDKIINTKCLPIILDVTNDCKQQYIDFNIIGKSVTQPNEILRRIKIQDNNKLPVFTRKSTKPIYIDVENSDEKYQVRVPESYYRIIEQLEPSISKRKSLHEQYILSDKSPIMGQLHTLLEDDREKVHKGESVAGNKNTSDYTNKPTPRLSMRYTKNNKRSYSR